MHFEADRMTNLLLTEEVVGPEREVVLEERRMRVDNDPGAQLDETLQATLFDHPMARRSSVGTMKSKRFRAKTRSPITRVFTRRKTPF